jgi:hypothetical protein
MHDDIIVPQEQTNQRINYLLEVLFKAFRLSENRIAQRLLALLFRPLVQRVVQIAGEAEETASKSGLAAATLRSLRNFTHLVKLSGHESLPSQGPLLIVSNHVGAFDIMLILSHLLREDVKIIASDLPIMHCFPGMLQYFIFTNFQPNSGMQAARQALRHLKEGGTLLLFASAGIDPDPANDAQAARQELNNWKPSLDIFLRQVPETQVVVSIVQGVISPRWIKHPLTRIGKRKIDQRRIGEILQIVQHLSSPEKQRIEPSVRFAPPLTAAELGGDARQALIRRGEEILQDSLKSL